MKFFQNSKMPVYQTMWEFMSGPHRQEVFVGSNTEGIEKVSLHKLWNLSLEFLFDLLFYLTGHRN